MKPGALTISDSLPGNEDGFKRLQNLGAFRLNKAREFIRHEGLHY